MNLPIAIDRHRSVLRRQHKAIATGKCTSGFFASWRLGVYPLSASRPFKNVSLAGAVGYTKRMHRIRACFLALTVAWPVWAAPPHPSLPSAVVPEGLGVNIHFTDARAGELEMLAAAGFHWVRMDFSWGGTERRHGEYDFSAYDRLLAALEVQKMRALFILDYGNGLYEADSSVATEAGRRAFARWAARGGGAFPGPWHPVGNLE